MKDITDNKTFWKTVKLNFNEKGLTVLVKLYCHKKGLF